MLRITYNYLGSVIVNDFKDMESFNNYYDSVNPDDNPFTLEVLKIETI